MSLEELERLALDCEMLPPSLPLEQQLLFLELRLLYRQYHSGIITKEQGRQEKQELIRSYRKTTEQIESDELLKLSREYLNKPVKYNDADYVVTALTVRLCEKGYYYQAELRDKCNHSVCIVRVEEVTF